MICKIFIYFTLVTLVVQFTGSASIPEKKPPVQQNKQVGNDSKKPDAATAAKTSPMVTQNKPQPTPQGKPQATPQGKPQEAAQKAPQITPQNKPQGATPNIPQVMAQNKPQVTAPNMPQVTAQKKPGIMNPNKPKGVTGRIRNMSSTSKKMLMKLVPRGRASPGSKLQVKKHRRPIRERIKIPKKVKQIWVKIPGSRMATYPIKYVVGKRNKPSIPIAGPKQDSNKIPLVTQRNGPLVSPPAQPAAAQKSNPNLPAATQKNDPKTPAAPQKNDPKSPATPQKNDPKAPTAGPKNDLKTPPKIPVKG